MSAQLTYRTTGTASVLGSVEIKESSLLPIMALHTTGLVTREFGHLLLHAYDLKKVFYGLGSGLRQNLSWDDFKYLPCLIPPPIEQTAVVCYLDYIESRIQRFINSSERRIELLMEQKYAVINETVTRGLNHNTPLKPSGIVWLGDIPAHWSLLPGKACYYEEKAPNTGMQEDDCALLELREHCH